MKTTLNVVLVILLFGGPVLARCPVTENTTVVIRAPAGNLQVDTSGQGFVDWELTNASIQVKENCERDRVEVTGTATAPIDGMVDWRITVPKAVDLDLVTFAGEIRVKDSDGNVTLRTTGGAVVAGNIGGRAAIVTQGGSVRTGNIGSSAELRSLGGSIEAGDVAGDAELETMGGSIFVGSVAGNINAQTAGGSITIRAARGEVNANTQAGDIFIGDAGRTIARTAGGNIIGQRIRGPFQGRTEVGDIRLDSVASWVEATTGFGNIVCRLVPDSIDSDLHIDLKTEVGDILLFIPEALPATLEAVVERATLEGQRILSDFPLNALTPATTNRNRVLPRLFAPLRSETTLNGGGNLIRARTSVGKIEIRRIK